MPCSVSFRSHRVITAVRWLCVVLGLCLDPRSGTLLAGSPALSADEDDEVTGGLIGTYTVGDQSVLRIDDRIAFDWGGHSPDPRLPEGPFLASWSGTLLIREGGSHHFHANICGNVTIRVDAQVVLKAESPDVGFHSGPAQTLSPGDHAISIDYQAPSPADRNSNAARRATIQIFWSSDTFTPEPLAADVLYCDPNVADGQSTIQTLQSQNRGMLLADALRCAACHETGAAGVTVRSAQPPIDLLSAPDLDRVRDGHTFDSLQRRLRSPSEAVPNSRMPHFDFGQEDAERIAAFLASVSKAPLKDDRVVKKSAEKPKVAKNKTEEEPGLVRTSADEGRLHLKSLGCRACHELSSPLSEQDSMTELDYSHAGPSLKRVATWRSAAWLSRWLSDPDSLNARHRMPVFTLTDDERRHIVDALIADSGSGPSRDSATERPPDNPSFPEQFDRELTEAGRNLITQANCAACHRIPGIPAAATVRLPVSRQDNSPANATSNSCLRSDVPANSAQNDPVRRHVSAPAAAPRFMLSDRQRDDLRAWFGTARRLLSAPGLHDHGSLLLTRNGCTACHDRDQQRGLSRIASQLEESSADLRGRSQLLIPPSLTAVGDKLTDAYLMDAVAGKQPSRRLPWLAVRMPRFAHSESDRKVLADHLVMRDRIPDAADAVRRDIADAVSHATSTVASADDLLLGNQLTGAAGFNCVACHSAGSFEPRNVALGTRGSDLLTMGQRLRSRFFLRWMKNPIRVVAGIEMPAIKRPAPGTPLETLNQQMTVIWKAIRDPRFTAPTVVSRYEQFVTVHPGERPRIIRDVFTIGEGKQRDSVARALAIGFSNGHNLLIDLDNLQLRQWTVGEFARQRTEGKSWFWGSAGVSVASSSASALGALPTLLFVDDTKGDRPGSEGRAAVIDESRTAELVRYQTDHESATLWYRVYFPLPGAKVDLNTSDVRGGTIDDSVSEDDPHTAVTRWNDPSRPVESVVIRETIRALTHGSESGWSREFELVDAPNGKVAVLMTLPQLVVEPAFPVTERIATKQNQLPQPAAGKTQTMLLRPGVPVARQGTTSARIPSTPRPELPILVTTAEPVTTLPGFDGLRLPVDASIMPTAMTWLADGRLAFTSLRGHVWIADDTNGDRAEDTLTLFEEGLAAPFGILSDGDSLIVAHKPELLRLRDTDGDGRADHREVIASGWGYSDDYHDWTSGLIRDDVGNLFVGLGSDYSQKDRSSDRDRWRGSILKVDPSGITTPIATGFRYPMSLALDTDGRLFATDNQGVQNTFNEINFIQSGRRYGVPSRHDQADNSSAQSPAIQIPHPWTRSVNSILFAPESFAGGAFAGQGIGCEYDLRFLIRFTAHQVGSQMQGAAYPFSLPNQEAGGRNFIGPICSAISPDGALYIGSIWDSGWQGGPNTGGIERLTAAGAAPNGIREVRATSDGFQIEFFLPVNPDAASDPTSYSVQGYTRVWEGSYATPDSDRHQRSVEQASVSSDNRSVMLRVPELKAGCVYDLSIIGALENSEPLWPKEAHYTLKAIPAP